MSTSFTAPKGTYDLLPPSSATYLTVVEKLSAPAKSSGYGYIQTPIFEDTALFQRGVGESTDVVTKEMYTFTDRGARSLTLRPEGTAGVMRAIVEHGLFRGQLPIKLWYTGPNFRYEQPQSGRYRQHIQVGIEAVGSDDPALDAEVVWIAHEGYRQLGLRNVTLLLNSLGCRECRPRYRQLLQEFLRTLDLDEDTRRRIDINPLRVLDDKRPEVRRQLTDAPLIVDHLCSSCREHFTAVQTNLVDLGVPWHDAPTLVRGLDYYTRTTFEFTHAGLGAQSALGGGGRYDSLLATVGGPDLGGIGFGLGVDRTVLALQAEGIAISETARCRAFIVPLGQAAKKLALPLAVDLRTAGVPTDMAFGERGLKGAMKAADKSGAEYAIIIGDRDLEANVVQVKSLAAGDQTAVPLVDLVTTMKEKLP